MYLRYSSIVVAPIVRNSPRASIGLSMFDASTEPSAAPAPTMVCSSSMNRMICPCASVTSFKRALRRSSNSPRNLAPAIMAPMSIAMIRFCFNESGTSPLMIRRASPSTIAVLPTPGSPISTGLFFVTRDAKFLQQFCRGNICTSQREQIMLRACELIFQFRHFLLCAIQNAAEFIRDVQIGGGAMDLRSTLQIRTQSLAQLIYICSDLLQERSRYCLALIEKSGKKMFVRDFRMISLRRQVLRSL